VVTTAPVQFVSEDVEKIMAFWVQDSNRFRFFFDDNFIADQYFGDFNMVAGD
jgi:hypothetical protein